MGPHERELIAESGWAKFPPRLPEQPIFYPVLNRDYACQIARDRNVRDSGAGYVTRFEVEAGILQRYPVRQVGGSVHMQLWAHDDEPEVFNRHIVGKIEITLSSNLSRTPRSIRVTVPPVPTRYTVVCRC